VPEFAVGADYLRYAFDIERLHVHPMSLYDCTTSEFLNHFDYVLVAGVLHHLTDPKLALRILYNCLRDGGTCLVETNSTEYEHVSNQSSHREPPCDRMFFTPDNLTTLMEDVGFDMRIRPRPIQYRTPEPRLFGAGRRPVGAT
jgi:SAM-dependent methyltransferase